jgi:multidrug efflux pump subunit AcrB
MKALIYWFTRNHVAANFLMIIILMGGTGTWFRLKKEIFPETAIDAVTISVPYPNATPTEVEKGVILPIEEAIEGIDGIKRTTSTSTQNVGAVTVEVETGYDVREVMSDIKSEVDAITNLADDTEEPILRELVLKGRVLQIAVSADTDERTLREMADRVKDELLVYEYTPPAWPGPLAGLQGILGRAGPFGVSQVVVNGTRPYEISIEISEQTLRELGLTFDHIADAVRASSLDLPGGSLQTEGGEFLIRTEARRYTAEEFGALTVVTRPDGSTLTLGEIATIRDGFEEVDLDVRFDGRPALLIDVFRLGNEDTLTIAEAAKAFIAERAPQILPAGVVTEVWADDSFYLRGRLDLLTRNLALGLALVLLVLALFLRPSLALLVTIGIPVSFAGAVMLMPATGISINMISLFAFILVLGIVVDDAIVVAENVYRRMRGGEHPRDAAPEGTHEVGVVVIFGVLTTVVAFTPMLGLSGVSGKIWPNIPWIVIPVLLFSLVQSKLILPAHLAMLRPSDPTVQHRGIFALQQAVAHGLERFVETVYRPILKRILHARYVTLSAFIAVFIASVSVVGAGWIKFQFFPEVEADVIVAQVELPAGVPYADTAAAVARMEQALLQLGREVEKEHGGPVLKHAVAAIGQQPFITGFEQIFGAPTATHIGEVTVELIPAAQRPGVSGARVASRWRELTGAIPGAVSLTFQTQGAASGNAIDLEVTGSDNAEIEAAAAMITDALAGYTGVIDISASNRVGKRELQLGITPQGEALGLRLVDVARQVRQGFYGEEVQRLQRGKDEVKVFVRYPRAEREMQASLDAVKIRTAAGDEVPFSEVATASYGRSYESIRHADGRRAVNVTADVDKLVGTNANEVVASLSAEVFPVIRERHPGVAIRFQGEQRDQVQSVQELSRGFILALVIMYVLMAIPLRSYFQPLIVMCVIPFGMIGAIIGHAFMGMSLSIMSMCGIVALAGVVVNDSLVLVDYVNREVARGHAMVEAAWHAGVVRFRPILLTSLTTFAGLTPMLLETDLQARFLIPMAVSLGFGILFATVITLFLVPCVYLIMADVQGVLARLWRGGNADLPLGR